MADVRLGAEAMKAALTDAIWKVLQLAANGRVQAAREAAFVALDLALSFANQNATVTLPDAKKCEADRGIDWYAAYERMAHNRNELWAKLKAVEAALAHKEGR